jgi:hypothetical protein
MSSETSSENNINYHDTNGKKIMSEIKHSKKESTETDFYFDMVANKEKIVVKSIIIYIRVVIGPRVKYIEYSQII